MCRENGEELQTVFTEPACLLSFVTVHTLPWWAAFVPIIEPVSIRYWWPEPQVYSSFHSWCCTFCEFWKMKNDMGPSLQFDREEFHYLEIALCFTSSTPGPPRPLKLLIGCLCPAFSRASCGWNHAVPRLPGLHSFVAHLFWYWKNRVVWLCLSLLSIHMLKDVSIASKFCWWIKLLWVCVQFFMWTWVFNSFVWSCAE